MTPPAEDSRGNNNRPKLVILADDLTGAADSGLGFARAGARTVVSFGASNRDVRRTSVGAIAHDVLVLDTESRAKPLAEIGRCRQIMTESLAALDLSSETTIYLKIDSTLRGQLWASVAAILDWRPESGVIVCPAFPAMGRTVRGGRLFLRGLPLEETEFARDPIWPIRESKIGGLIESQRLLGDARAGSHPCHEIDLRTIRMGSDSLKAALTKAWDARSRIVVCDAEEDRDLAVVAKAVLQSGGKWVGAGSAGLAGLLGSLLMWDYSYQKGPKDRVSADRLAADRKGKIVVVVGSNNAVARRQIAELAPLIECDGWRSAELSSKSLLLGAEGITHCLDEALTGNAPGVIVSLRDDLTDREKAIPSTPERLIGALGAAIGQSLIGSSDFSGEGITGSGLVLTGGDTAMAVLSAIGTSSFRVEREVAPGIPRSTLIDGRYPGLRIVTKAGGFGAPDALLLSARYLEAKK